MRKKRVIKRAKKKKDFSFRDEYKEIVSFLKGSRDYIYFVILLFGIFFVLGFFFEDIINSLFNIFGVNLNQVLLDYMRELLLQTEGMDFKQLSGFIFLNNFQSSLSGMVFGLLFGVFPIIVAVMNGYVLGFVGILSVRAEGLLILWRILPHGIFELPAIFISIALGLKLGHRLAFKSKDLGKSVLYVIVSFVCSIFAFSLVLLLFAIISLIFVGFSSFSLGALVPNSLLNILIYIVILILSFYLWTFILGRSEAKKVKELIVKSLKTFLLVVFPLLVIAAIVEGLLIVLSS